MGRAQRGSGCSPNRQETILNQQPSEHHRDEEGVILAQFPLAMHSKRLNVFGTELTDRLMVHRLRFLKDCSPISQSKDQDVKRRNKRTRAVERGSECKPSLPLPLLCMKHHGGTLSNVCTPCFLGQTPTKINNDNLSRMRT